MNDTPRIEAYISWGPHSYDPQGGGWVAAHIARTIASELATALKLHTATVAQNDELRRIIAELEAALAATQADKMQWVDEATKAHDALVSAQRCCKKDAGGARQ